MTDPTIPTEASCLLQTGALYVSRIGLARGDSSGLVFAGFKKGSFSLYFGDEPIYHFDLEGRWQRAFVEDIHYLKALDTSTQAVDRVREGSNMVLRRRRLDGSEVRAMDRRVRTMALELLAELRSGRFRHEAPPDGRARPLESGELFTFLERIADWDDDSWDAHRDRCKATYGPLPLLPPDCQHAIILQATYGNAPGGAFGRGPHAAHRVRTPEEFRGHLGDVKSLLGGRLEQSRIAFLGGNGAILQEPRWVEAYLEAVADILPIGTDGGPAARGGAGTPPRLQGIHAFVDRFDAPRPSRDALRAFRGRHLTSLSLGIASGDPVVRERLGAAWTDEDLRSFVDDLRAAGIRLSVLTLADAGGSDRQQEHLARTTDLVRSLELGRSENVFILDSSDVMDLDERGASIGRGEGTPAARDRLRDALAPLRERGAKVLVYSADKHWA
ncbi:hypothetical protein [Aquisphaera insulae]|uniref:hypothetical protein n=1 Tax=Aquisphaera insulae TaxID=2712864 RepID=UPI0013EDF3B3|nr:hypothetical protein [Aquisphaera insulae]